MTVSSTVGVERLADHPVVGQAHGLGDLGVGVVGPVAGQDLYHRRVFVDVQDVGQIGAVHRQYDVGPVQHGHLLGDAAVAVAEGDGLKAVSGQELLEGLVLQDDAVSPAGQAAYINLAAALGGPKSHRLTRP